MGVFAGPEIAESGLVLALDAGNTKGFDDDENLLTYSEQFNNAAWSKNNYNVTANATTAPDGTLTADKLIAINASTFHDLYKSPGLGSNTYTLSIFAKVAEQSFIQLRIDDGAISRLAMFNLSTGSVSSSSNVTSPTITSYPNGWYRCSITVTSAIVNVVFNGYPTSSNATYSGDGVSGVFIWGAQFEYGSVATGYTPTTTTAKTRGTTWTDLSGNGNTGTLVNGVGYSASNGGALVFDGVDDNVGCGNDASINFGTGDFTVSVWFRRFSNATGNLRLLSKAAGGDTANAASAGFSFFGADTGISFAVNPTAARTIIGAASYSLNEWVNVVGLVERGVSMRTYKNASLVASTTAPSGSVSGTTSLFIGNNVGSNLHWAGEVSNTLLYNKALTPQEIQQNFNALRSRFQ